MTNSAQLNSATFAAVKPGMEESLAVIRTQLEQYFAAPESGSGALDAARSELRRLIGVLRMVRLDGEVVFCGEVEAVLNDLVYHAASALHHDVLNRTVDSLARYLNDLSLSVDNVATLRLFPQYQEMQHLRGLEMSFEQDLFYPGLDVSLPENVLAIPFQEVVEGLRAVRTRYQLGLIAYLRQTDEVAALTQMQRAVETVTAAIPQDQSRAFWWISNGLLDCIRMDGLPPDLNACRLLGRVDQQIRAVIEGSSRDLQSALNGMLYMIGRSRAVSELVDGIKQAYTLDRYLPEPFVLSPGELAGVLQEMRTQLTTAEERWERSVQGDADAYEKFVEATKALAVSAEKLERNTLQYLTRQVLQLAQRDKGAESAREIATDMAMSLLLLDSGLTHYGNLSGSFQNQAKILVERMQAAIAQQPEDAQQLLDMIELNCEVAQDDVMTTLLNEMLVNLDQVEQRLNDFLGDDSKHDQLKDAQRLLEQMRGGLRILFLEQAEQLLLAIKEVVNSYVLDASAANVALNQTLASAVSTLGSYLRNLSYGQDDSVLLRESLAALTQSSHGVVSAAADAAATVASDAGVQQLLAEDQELLEIFLEEAQEVLGIMRENIELCRLYPDRIDPLVTIRRGFHTLKGSGRMVGLTDFGEVAWCVERALNKWLQDNIPATPALLRFIVQATEKFSSWTQTLQEQSHATIDGAGIIALAQQVENGEPLTESESGTVIEQPISDAVLTESAESASAQKKTENLADGEAAGKPVAPLTDTRVAPAIDVEPVTEVASDEILIGEIAVPLALFDIASVEAKQNATALHEHFSAMQTTQPPTVSYDFMRAAHTLAGVCRTMGFVGVADLAYALESWLQARLGVSFTLSNAQSQLLVQTLVALEVMTTAVCAQEMPQARVDLVNQLLADKENLHEIIDAPAAGQASSPDGAPSASPAREAKPEIRDDVDEQLLEIFLEEAADLYPKISAGIRAWEETPEDSEQADLLKRLLHTMKGSARMAGAMRVGEAAHAMEDRVLAAAREQTQAGYWDDLKNELDHVNALLEELRTGKPAEPVQPTFGRRSEDRFGGVERRAERRTLDVGAERALLGNVLRVRSDIVDRLVNEASEISVTRSRVEIEMDSIKNGLQELSGSMNRLRMQLREVEMQAESQIQARVSVSSDDNEQFDPLEFDRFTRLQELTRFMNESVHDVQTVQQSLLRHLDEASAAMSMQSRLNGDLHQSLMNVRMIPFSNISERLYRVVRQTGKDLGKRANLELEGVAVELDRSVLEKMTAPFEHMLRNALAHGLESESEREQQGKSPIGEIRVKVHQESNEIVFEFSDDGVGLNYDALREKAIAQGLLSAEQTASEEQLAELIFTSGLSTAESVTEVAGRGVGMDVVRSEITTLGGRIDVKSEKGKGTQFIIHLPLTLAVTQTVMVRCGDATYAIPSAMVAQVQQIKDTQLADLYREGNINWGGNSYPVRYLGSLLGGAAQSAEPRPRIPLLLLRSGNQHVALQVDEMVGNREVVVKNIGPQLARHAGIAGATVLGNGAVVLMLDPLQLVRRGGVAKTVSEKPVVEVAAKVAPLVMVVDDSLTIRKITTRLLERAGYQVVTATDGVDALEKLVDVHPLVMLLDVEMPRMDGFELTKRLRREEKTKDLPIIMITSRTADKHRDYAMELGVNTYLGKPYQDDELLQNVADFMASHKLGDGQPVSEPQVAKGKSLIMVVDDSLTIRKITSRLLERSGYQVVTATDGVDALEKLADVNPAVMLLDVEMPRMDGFELTRRLRREEKTKNLPIIMITSRTADKHRDHAMELGVNTYLGKPYQDDVLLQNVADFMVSQKKGGE
ncbi:MAG: response regulator [Pseudomonadota bacterium]